MEFCHCGKVGTLIMVSYERYQKKKFSKFTGIRNTKREDLAWC